MKISEEIYEKMPDDLKALFDNVHNSSCPEEEFARQSKAMGMHSAGGKTQGKVMPAQDFGIGMEFGRERMVGTRFGDSGSASRFFYSAKASKKDRLDSKHPTVKPISLMRYLCRLITPYGGTVLDPFAGSGTTGQAAIEEGFRPILIEREAEYYQDILNRFNQFDEEVA